MKYDYNNFTYTTKYDTYPGCFVDLGRYYNDRLAIEITSCSEGAYR